ncbi:MAG: pyruvate synthase [candidate division Zixibacteria bacterium]|nr:pyruvate synthase [candidate division Zixibacteria bacterium]
MSKPILTYTGPGTSKANKTGAWRTNVPIFKHVTCNDCRICVVVCPDACVTGEDSVYEANLDFCKGCGICAYECPKDDIDMKLEEK